MIAQIRAELLKVRSTRTTIGLILEMIALILLFTLLTGLTHPSGLASKEDPVRRRRAVAMLRELVTTGCSDARPPRLHTDRTPASTGS